MTVPPTNQALLEFLPRQTVAVAGLGLLGGSLCMALRRACPELRILACARRPETVRDALEQGVADSASIDPAEILPSADLTIVCMPIDATIRFISENGKLWSVGTIVTDVGSTKGSIVRALAPVSSGHGFHFIGSHPMAGAEVFGLDHAFAELYENAIVFLTGQEGDDERALAAIRCLWRTVGARPVDIALDRHDALVARTSHVLHLVAGAAVDAIADDDMAPLATAGGFRDLTRIAASSPDMWIDILKDNRDNVVAALDGLLAEQSRLRCLMIENRWDDIHEFLQTAKAGRDAWFAEWTKVREADE